MSDRVCAKCGNAYPAEASYWVKRTARDTRVRHCRVCERKRVATTQRLSSYGLTVVGYQALLRRQRGVCAICRQPPTGRELDVDHCHTSNKVRGLLCSNCNRGIGLLGDDTERLGRARRYLLKAERDASPVSAPPVAPPRLPPEPVL